MSSEYDQWSEYWCKCSVSVCHDWLNHKCCIRWIIKLRLYRRVQEAKPFLLRQSTAALQWLVSFCLWLCLPLQLRKIEHTNAHTHVLLQASVCCFFAHTCRSDQRVWVTVLSPDPTHAWVKTRTWRLHQVRNWLHQSLVYVLRLLLSSSDFTCLNETMSPSSPSSD